MITIAIQRALAAAGFNTDGADDIGPKTKAAVKAFQKANGLKPDGIVGPVTAAALGLTLTPAGGAAQSPAAAASTVYAGFDAFAYPGDNVMDWLKAHTNLCWVCVYLKSPSNDHASYGTWMPAVDRLRRTGWGMAPTYVGQQVTGKGSHVVTAAQGEIDGADAVGTMKSLGFPPGSCVFLDLENGPPLTDAQKAYTPAWADKVAAGGFSPGIYCSYLLGSAIRQLLPQARIWVFHVATTAAHNVDAPYLEKSPVLSGFSGATLWQRDDAASIVTDAAGNRSQVDLNTSLMPDPSSPAGTA
jgi:putative peptidoglycan binding protein/glycoside hydrolase-like protein